MRTLLSAFLAVVASTAVLAAPSPARPEIDTLLARLQASGCEFNRNGAWHNATDAKAHLLRKLEYLEGKGMVSTTEQFIELAATSSSSSGKPYLVRCGGAAAVPSKVWLSNELKAARTSGRAASSPK